MNPYAIPPFLAMLFLATMGTIVYLRDKTSKIHILFLAKCSVMVVWLIGFVSMYASHDEVSALKWGRLGFVGVCFIPPTILHFNMLFLKKMHVRGLRNLLWFSYFVAGLGAVLSPTGLVYRGIWTAFWGYYPMAGPLYFIFPITFFICFTTVSVILFLDLRKEKDWKRQQQIKYMLFGSICGTPGIVDYISKYQLSIYPCAYIAASLWMFWLAYAIIKHQLMDIRIVIKRSLVYSISLTVISIVFLVSVLVFERIFQVFVGYQTTYGSISSVILIAIVFTPIKNKTQHFIDKIFYKGSQEEIARQNEMLRQEVTQSERYKTLADLTSNIIDEIKDPLTTLKGYGHFLSQKRDDKEFLEKFSKVQAQELDKINELLQQLTTYSKPMSLALEETNIIRLLSDTIGMLKGTLFEQNIILSKSFKVDQACYLNIDPNQIRQAFINIINNSIEALPQGGEIQVKTEQAGNSLKIIIKDCGEGIPPQHITRAFDPFFSLKEHHVGLGLSIVQGIIGNHEGKVKVWSKVGLGTEVIIELPLKDQKS